MRFSPNISSPQFLGKVFLVLALSLGIYKLATDISLRSGAQSAFKIHDKSGLAVERENNRMKGKRMQGSTLDSAGAEQVSTGHTTQTLQTERARLMKSRQELMKQLADSSVEERHKAMELWHQENAETLAFQRQLAIQVSAESRQPLLRFPPAPRFSEDTTIERREFLNARYEVMKDRVEIMNRLRDITPVERQQAMALWHEENASRLSQSRKTLSPDRRRYR